MVYVTFWLRACFPNASLSDQSEDNVIDTAVSIVFFLHLDSSHIMRFILPCLGNCSPTYYKQNGFRGGRKQLQGAEVSGLQLKRNMARSAGRYLYGSALQLTL